MKNAMKRIMSFVLVALLLVSALPLGASAAIIGGSQEEPSKVADEITKTDIVEDKVDEESSEEDYSSEDYGIMPANLDEGISSYAAIASSLTVHYHAYMANGTTAMGATYMQTETLDTEGDPYIYVEEAFEFYDYKDEFVVAGLYEVISADNNRQMRTTDPMYPDGEYIIKLDHIRPITVNVHYANDTKTVGPIQIFVKSAIGLDDLLSAAGRDPQFKDLRISFDPDLTEAKIDGRRATINNSTASAGQTVDFYLYDDVVSGGTGIGSIGGGSNNPGNGGNDDGDIDNDFTYDPTGKNFATVRVARKINGVVKSNLETLKITDSDGMTLPNVLKALGYFGYTIDYAKVNDVTLRNPNTYKLNNGETAYIMLEGDSFSGGSNSGSSDPDDYYRLNEVYLHVFLEDQFRTPNRTIALSEKAPSLLDDSLTMSEVEEYLLTLYKAKTSKGIRFLGLYESKGTWEADMINMTDAVPAINNLVARRADEPIHVNVMLQNAVRKNASTSTADTSNPKTGDTIYVPVAILGVSATALATVMYFYNKKRVAR